MKENKDAKDQKDDKDEKDLTAATASNAKSKDDPSKDDSKNNKGRKFKALVNVSFGTQRDPVKAGEVFQLDDQKQIDLLLNTRSITPDLDFVEETNKMGGTNSGVAEGHLPAGQTQTAAQVRGNAADKAAADAGKPVAGAPSSDSK